MPGTEKNEQSQSDSHPGNLIQKTPRSETVKKGTETERVPGVELRSQKPKAYASQGYEEAETMSKQEADWQQAESQKMPGAVSS